MTIDEAADFLFVSRSHVRRLPENGTVRGALGDDGEYIVDDWSVRTYKAELNERAKRFFDAQTEDNEPPGL
jgi:hypothetical protein